MPSGLTSYVLLGLSLAALGAGPWLHVWLRSNAWMLRVLDGLVTVGVGGLVLVHVLPPSIASGGLWSLFFVLAGVSLPTLIERFQHGRHEGAHTTASLLAGFALAIHALTDGLGLSLADTRESLPIAVAVVLHRLPVGLAIWMVFRRTQGTRAAYYVLVLCVLGTLVGFFSGGSLMGLLQSQGFAWVQAFVAGSLLHVIFHAHEHDHTHGHGHVHGPADGHGHGPGHGHEHGPADGAGLGASVYLPGARLGANLAPPRGAVSFRVSRPSPVACGDALAEESWNAAGLSFWGRFARFLDLGAVRAQSAELLGAVVGGAVVVLVSWVERASHGDASGVGSHDLGGAHVHGASELSVSANGFHAHAHVVSAEGWARILELALGAAPWLLAGYLSVALIPVFFRPLSTSWLVASGRVSSAFRGLVFGFSMPVRACSVVPSFEAQVRRGAPSSGAGAFLLSSPHLRPEALLFSVPLLGLPLAGVRVFSVLMAAFLGGLLLSVVEGSSSSASSSSLVESGRGERLSLLSGLRYGLFRVVDDTAPWVLVAFLVVGIFAPASLSVFSTWPVFAELLFFAALGVPVYLCSSAAMPLSALLIAAGVSPGAALVFILSGPVAYVSVRSSLQSRYGARASWLVLVLIVSLAVFFGWVTELWATDLIARTQPDLVHVESSIHRHRAGNLVQWVALASIGVLFVSSFMRRGPRAWLNTVVAGDHG